ERLETNDEPAVHVVAADDARALVGVGVQRKPVACDLQLPVRSADHAEGAADPPNALRHGGGRADEERRPGGRARGDAPDSAAGALLDLPVVERLAVAASEHVA